MRITDLSKQKEPVWFSDIFRRIYVIKVRQIDLRSTAMIQRYGLPTVRNAAIDRNLSESITSIGITIAGIEEHFKNRIPMRIPDADLPTMYDAIQTYLSIWLNYLRGLNWVPYAPVRDLISLDNLNEMIFTNMKQVSPQEAKIRHFKSIGFNSEFLNRFGYVNTLVNHESNIVPTDLKYNGYSSLLKPFLHLDTREEELL